MARRNYSWDATVKTLHLHICISTAPEMLHVNLFHVLNPIGGVLASPLEGGAVLSASESSDAIINMTLCGCQVVNSLTFKDMCTSTILQNKI